MRLSDAVTVWWNPFFLQCKLVWSGLQISDAVLLLDNVCSRGLWSKGLLRSIITPEGSSYCVRHVEEEVSFAFFIVNSLHVPGVRRMPESWTDSERGAVILMHVLRQSVLQWESAQCVCVCVMHRARPRSMLSWAAGWFPFSLPSLNPIREASHPLQQIW